MARRRIEETPAVKEHAPVANTFSEPETDEGPSTGSVTVTWGEEIFSPQQFHTWKVGPFSSTVNIREGESLVDCARRAMRELTVFAEAEREKKKASYLTRIDGRK